jgi:hypothetical protein
MSWSVTTRGMTDWSSAISCAIKPGRVGNSSTYCAATISMRGARCSAKSIPKARPDTAAVSDAATVERRQTRATSLKSGTIVVGFGPEHVATVHTPQP